MELSKALEEYGVYHANTGKPDFITWLFKYHPEEIPTTLTYGGRAPDSSARDEMI